MRSPFVIRSYRLVTFGLTVVIFSLSSFGQRGRGENDAFIQVSISVNAETDSQLDRVYEFLWQRWKLRQVATAQVEFYGRDFVTVHSVHLKPNARGRWTVAEYFYSYHLWETVRKRPKLVLEGNDLQQVSLGAETFRLSAVTGKGKAIPLFGDIR